jgi:hypothetical protein
MQHKLPKTQKRLLKEFPQMDMEMVEDIDVKIKTKVLIYQSDNINKDVSTVLQEEIKKHIKVKNTDKLKKKCNKLASEYLENNRIWMLQENWFCLLAYFITITTMILRTVEVETEVNDKISLVMYGISLVLWLIMVNTKRLMSLKVEKFLNAFNNHAPSVIFTSSLVFYLTVCLCTCRCIWWAVIVLSFLVCIYLTYLWYKRENEK